MRGGPGSWLTQSARARPAGRPLAAAAAAATLRQTGVSRRALRALAAAAPVADAAAPASEVVYQREFPLGGSTVNVRVEVSPEGDQTVDVTTGLSGRLLLHWGVEGGAGYKGGWRLPPQRCRPEGTVQYKQRALQTPFAPRGASNGNGNGSGGLQGVVVRLTGGEASEYFNFVVKVGGGIPGMLLLLALGMLLAPLPLYTAHTRVPPAGGCRRKPSLGFVGMEEVAGQQHSQLPERHVVMLAA